MLLLSNNNNILNYWLSLCSKCPPFAFHTHEDACAPLPNCHSACSIISRLMVVRFIDAEKQHSNKVLPLGARMSGNYASPCRWMKPWTNWHPWVCDVGDATVAESRDLSLLRALIKIYRLTLCCQIDRHFTCDKVLQITSREFSRTWQLRGCRPQGGGQAW